MSDHEEDVPMENGHADPYVHPLEGDVDEDEPTHDDSGEAADEPPPRRSLYEDEEEDEEDEERDEEEDEDDDEDEEGTERGKKRAKVRSPLSRVTHAAGLNVRCSAAISAP